MTKEKFGEQVKRLVNTYSDKAYGNERIQILWREMKDFSDEWFEQTVSNLIGSCRQAPLLPEFREAVSKEREKHLQAAREKSGNEWSVVSSCSFCFGCGVYLCNLRGAVGFWAFRCHCDAGMRDVRKHIPQFKQAHRDQGYFCADVKQHAVRA